MTDLHKMKESIQKRSPNSIFNILVHSCASTATDLKDMIYGVLALIKRIISDASPLQSMEVNYRLSTAEVYTKFTRLLLLEYPQVLLIRNHHPELQAYAAFRLELPSWVPNYADRMNFGQGDFAFKLSNNAAKLVPPSLLVVRRPDGLALNAQRVDIIEERVMIFNGDFEDNWIARALPTLLRFLCTIEPVYFDGQPRSQALWLTLASGIVKAGLGTANKTTVESLRPIFGLWVGQCLFTLARMRSAKSGDIRDTYFSILADLWEPLATLSQSEPHIFLGLDMLVNFPANHMSADVLSGVERFHRMMQEPSNLQRPVLFRTRDGLLGKCSKNVQEGDEVWLAAGMPVPSILRKAEEQDCFRNIDITYVHGIMQGEYIDRYRLRTREIELI